MENGCSLCPSSSARRRLFRVFHSTRARNTRVNLYIFVMFWTVFNMLHWYFCSRYGSEAELDNTLSIGKSSVPSSLHFSESFGGDGFLDSSGYPYYPSTNQTPVKQLHGVQRVPETPALRRAICATPQTEDCRLNFSCKYNCMQLKGTNYSHKLELWCTF